MNLGSYHPINKPSVIWDCDSETDAETGCASLFLFFFYTSSICSTITINKRMCIEVVGDSSRDQL